MNFGSTWQAKNSPMAAFEKIIIPSFHQNVANSAFLSIAFNIFIQVVCFLPHWSNRELYLNLILVNLHNTHTHHLSTCNRITLGIPTVEAMQTRHSRLLLQPAWEVRALVVTGICRGICAQALLLARRSQSVSDWAQRVYTTSPSLQDVGLLHCVT